MEKFNLAVATLIKTDGTRQELTPANGKSFKYEEMRDVVYEAFLITKSR